MSSQPAHTVPHGMRLGNTIAIQQVPTLTSRWLQRGKSLSAMAVKRVQASHKTLFSSLITL
jgi:hypothetical protein